jgi:hypothetical protein
VETAAATNVAVPAPTRDAPDVLPHRAYVVVVNAPDAPQSDALASHSQLPVQEPWLEILAHVITCAT